MGVESLKWQLMSTIEPEETTWLWPGWVPMGMISIIDGDPGVGKSSALFDIASRVSTTGIMPDGSFGAIGGVLLLSAEEHKSKTTIHKFIHGSANLTRIGIASDIMNETSSRPIMLPRDLKYLAEAVDALGIKLVILDTLFHFLDCDVNSDKDIKQNLHPVKEWVEANDVALVGIRHLNKGSGMKALYRGSGSIGIAGASRSAMICTKDPDDDTRYILGMNRLSVAANPTSLYYRIVQAEHGHCKVQWEGDCHLKAEEMVATPISPEDKDAENEARDFLTSLLQNGPVKSQEAKQAGKDVGIAFRTLERAKAKHKPKITSYKSSYDGCWYWSIGLPNLGGLGQTTGLPQQLGGLGDNDEEATT